MNKILTLIFGLAFILINHGCQNPTSENTNNCNNVEKQNYFYHAFENNSTSPDFLIFKAVDKRTGINKEICCGSDQLYRAILNEGFVKRQLNDPLREYNAIKKSKPCDHLFEFYNKKSLEIIGFYTSTYNFQIEDSINKNLDYNKIDLILKSSSSKKPVPLYDYFEQIEDYRKELNLIHFLTSKGIYCGRDCLTGTIMIKKVIK